MFILRFTATDLSAHVGVFELGVVTRHSCERVGGVAEICVRARADDVRVGRWALRAAQRDDERIPELSKYSPDCVIEWGF